MEVFKNDFVEIFFDEDLVIFQVIHLRPMLDEEFYELLDIKIALMKKIKENHPLKCILTDARKIGPMNPETVDFSNKYYDPKLIALGIERFAFVQPENIFANVNIKDYVNSQTHASLQKGMFLDVASALEWLIQK